jgi:hypothetical protein
MRRPLGPFVDGGIACVCQLRKSSSSVGRNRSPPAIGLGYRSLLGVSLSDDARIPRAHDHHPMHARRRRGPRLRPGVQFDTKIAVVLRDDLLWWQKTNVTAFLVSGIAGTVPGVVGEAYRDASGNKYLPMFVQPVLVYEANADSLRRAFERAKSRGITPAIYTQELFATNHDEANRAAVASVSAEDLDLVGLAVRAERKTVDKIVDRLRFHP